MIGLGYGIVFGLKVLAGWLIWFAERALARARRLADRAAVIDALHRAIGHGMSHVQGLDTHTLQVIDIEATIIGGAADYLHQRLPGALARLGLDEAAVRDIVGAQFTAAGGWRFDWLSARGDADTDASAHQGAAQ